MKVDSLEDELAAELDTARKRDPRFGELRFHYDAGQAGLVVWPPEVREVVACEFKASYFSVGKWRRTHDAGTCRPAAPAGAPPRRGARGTGPRSRSRSRAGGGRIRARWPATARIATWAEPAGESPERALLCTTAARLPRHRELARRYDSARNRARSALTGEAS